MKNGSLTREVLAAWVVASVPVAVALILLALYKPDTEDRVRPWVYGPPAAAAEPSADGVFVRRGAGWDPPLSGSSTAPGALPEERQLPARHDHAHSR